MDTGNSTERATQTIRTIDNIPLTIEEVFGSGHNTDKSRKTHISQFKCLINSNKAAKTKYEAQKILECLRSAMRFVLEHKTREIIYIKPPHDQTDRWDSSHIFEIKIKMAGEIGPRYKRVHLHCVITIKHNTYLFINKERLHELVLEHCAGVLDSIFTSVRFQPVSMAEYYLDKDPLPS
jgi:hypothetical protein